MTLTYFSLVFVTLSVVLATALSLVHPSDRWNITALILVGAVSSFFKVSLIQQAPQWHDTPPDSVKYETMARAFSDQWSNADELNKSSGYVWQGSQELFIWKQEPNYTYKDILGTREWLYPAYIGLWQKLTGLSKNWIIASNIAWLAFLPAAAFGLTLVLFESRRLSWVSAFIVLIEPMSAVNASWALKDSLAACLSMGALWSGAEFIRQEKKAAALILIASISLLSIVRYVSFLALILSLVLVLIWLLYTDNHKLFKKLFLTIATSAIVTAYLYQTPSYTVLPFESLVNEVFAQPLAGARQVFSDPTGDEAVAIWRESLTSDPISATSQAIARTLFAPYPWVAIYPGLTGELANELYYPGMLLWIMCLPGIFFAIGQAFKKFPDITFWFLLFYIVSVIGAYMLFYGEWSTRQRVFLLPAFAVLTSLGWYRIYSEYFPTLFFKRAVSFLRVSKKSNQL